MILCCAYIFLRKHIESLRRYIIILKNCFHNDPSLKWNSCSVMLTNIIFTFAWERLSYCLVRVKKIEIILKPSAWNFPLFSKQENAFNFNVRKSQAPKFLIFLKVFLGGLTGLDCVYKPNNRNQNFADSLSILCQMIGTFWKDAYQVH